MASMQRHGHVEANLLGSPPNSQSQSKALRGLRPNDPLPGAYKVQRRAQGEVPSWGRQHDDNNDEECASVIENELVERQESIHRVFEAELATTQKKNQLVIEGVNSTKTWPRQLYIRLLGGITLASAVTLAAVLITTWLTSSSHSNNINPNVASGKQDSASPDLPYTIRWNRNWTIADALSSKEPSISILPGGPLFLEILSRTDTNFTFFGIKRQLDLLTGLEPSLLSKLVSPSWTSHTLDIMKALTLQDQLIEFDTMNDNELEFTSMAGYPLRVQLNPFQVDNVTMVVDPRDQHFQNGVMHIFLECPKQLAPWIGKSMYIILQETNNLRQGDISGFISLVRAMPDLFDKLQAKGNEGITLFVPTNDALAVSDPSLLEEIQGELDSQQQQIVLNHVVTGNFARSCWWVAPAGTVMSDSALMLESQAGQILDLKINHDEAIRINGSARIIQEDIFCEQGVVQIVDKVLSE